MPLNYAVEKTPKGRSFLRSVSSGAVTAEDVVALWGSETTLVDPEAGDWPAGNALLIDAQGKAQPIDEWKLGPKWVEADALAQLASEGRTYENSPLIWFARPETRVAGSGLLRLVTGEEIVLEGPKSSKGGFSLVTWSAAGATIARVTKARREDVQVTTASLSRSTASRSFAASTGKPSRSLMRAAMVSARA